MKQVMQYSSPLDFGALRYFGGALVLFAVLLIRRQSLLPPPLLPTLVVGLAQTTAFQALAQLAIAQGEAGKISLYSYTMPFWVVLLTWFILKEKPQPKQWLAISFAALGLILVIAPWQASASLTSVTLAIGGGLAWALGTVLSKWMFQRYSLSPLNFTAWQMLLGSLALIAITLCVPSRSIEWSHEFIFGLAYSVFLASSLAWLLWSFLVRALPAPVIGLASLMVPLTAILLAWLILAEQPSSLEALGIGVIMLALFIVRPNGQKS